MPSKLASLAAYVPLQAALLPAGLASMATSGFLQSTVSRRLGVSQTAVQVLSGRYAMHRFGIREDVAAAKLFRALPNGFATGLDVALFPLWVKHKISDDYFLGGTSVFGPYAVVTELRA